MAYLLERMIIAPIYKLWIRKVTGMNNIPLNTGFIVAINHTSYFDIWMLPILIQRRIKIQMHAFVNSRYWKSKIAKMFLNYWLCLPVYVKESKDKNKESVQKAVEYLKKGHMVMIFPEGTRSTDGKIKKAYNGVGKLAIKAKVPVLPSGIIDSYKVIPKGKIFPRFKRCEVNIGKPIYFKNKPNKKNYENATRKIMKEIARLSNQKYNY